MRTTIRFVLAACLLAAASCGGPPGAASVPERAAPAGDLAAFGRMSCWTGDNQWNLEVLPVPRGKGAWVPADGPGEDERQIGVEWDEPRDVEAVEVVWYGAPPAADSVRLEYWHYSWPPKFSGGWTFIDDPFRGGFARAAAEVSAEGETQRFTCGPIAGSEFKEAAKAAKVKFRRTLKVRVVVKGAAPDVRAFRVFSPHPWKETAVVVQFGQDYRSGKACWDGRAEAENAAVPGVEPLPGGSFETAPDGSWKGTTSGRADGVLLRLRYLDGKPNHSDQAKILLRTRERSVTFNVTDLLENGPLDVRDCGVYIAPAEAKEDVAAYRTRTAALAGRSVYDRVPSEPEQSYARASREIPQLMPEKHQPHGMYLPLGPDRSRQEIVMRYNGSFFLHRSSLWRPGPDTKLLRFRGEELHYRVGTGAEPDFREKGEGVSLSLEERVLPIPIARWERGGLKWEETAFGTFLHHRPDAPDLKGTEPTAAFVRLTATNPSDEPRDAVAWLRIGPGEAVAFEDGFVAASAAADVTYAPPVVRAAMKASAGEIRAEGSEPVRWAAKLAPKSSATLFLVIPFATDGNAKDRAAMKEADFEKKLDEVKAYWRGLVDRGAKLFAGEEKLNLFSQAVFPHIAISADPDHGTGHLMLPAATLCYCVAADESGYQIRALDRWGYHEWAEKALQPFLDLQGSAGLDGRFRSHKSVLRALVIDGFDYENSSYSISHGYLMMTLGEHYKLTGDREWVLRSAPKLIAACDFVTRERQATKKSPFEEDPLEYGLLPACHLEDNSEWLYWYCVNAFAYRGMQWIGEALAEAGHPEAKRIQNDAADYRKDLRRSLFRAIERSPVVRLRDGTAIPHVPVRARLRGRDLGWIREALYGTFMYVYSGIFDADEPVVTWIAKDHEDNIFVDPRWGRKLPSEETWFSQGGITLQCNLLPNPVVYLDRDQVEHAIRGLFNGLAASLYPGESYCFAEHPVQAYGHGVGPFYKTPDESGMLHWYRELLVHEEGDRLILAKGTPRAWLEEGKRIDVQRAATYFGPVTYLVESRADGIRAVIEPPKRKPPAGLILRLRHPQKKRIKSVTLDGKPWTKFDADREWIELPVREAKIELVARY